jgi:hypothetical protein
MIHPDEGKVYVPEDVDDVWAIESNKVYHKADSKTWASNEWGYEEHMHKQVQKPRVDKAGETAEQKQARLARDKDEMLARRKEKYNAKKRCETAARELFDTHGGALAPDNIWNIMKHIESQLSSVQTQRKQAIATAKTEHNGEANTGVGARREAYIHSQTTAAVNKEVWAGHLQEISSWCSGFGLNNTLGTQFPATHDVDGYAELYISVAESFLIRAMRLILDGTCHLIRKKMKIAGAQVNHTEIHFLNLSDKAVHLHNHKKDHYPKNSPKGWLDKTALDAWHKTARALDKAEWIKRHGKKELPKRLHEPGSAKEHEAKGKPAAHGNPSDIMQTFREFEAFRKAYAHHGDGKHHHAAHDHGKGGPRATEPAQTYSRRRGKAPGAATYMRGYRY